MSDEPTDPRARSSWRKSLGAVAVGLMRVFEPAVPNGEGETGQGIAWSTREELRRSAHIIDPRGVSVLWLVQFGQDILDGKVAPGVKLFTANVELAEDVPAGHTMDANGRVPHRKSGEPQRFTKRAGLRCRKVDVTRKPREDWTVSDVANFVIITNAQVQREKCFFIDTLASEHVGQPFQGAFVSQARSSSRFVDLIAALVRHYTKDGAQEIPTDAFVWLDLFSANQPLLTQQGDDTSADVMREREALLSGGLHLVIAQFDERLFFFDSLLTPALLKRMWCVWEIYGAIKSGEKMTVIFAPGEEDRFVDAINDDPGKIAEHVANMRPDQAQCFDEKDREMITAAVEGSVGWPKLKQMIMEQLNTWMLLEAEASVKRVAAEEGSGESEAFGRLLVCAGLFMDINGQLDVALSYYKKAVGVYVAVHGTEGHTDVAAVLGNMAVVYEAQGKLDKALETYQRSLDITVAAYGTEEHKSVAVTLNNMAGVYEAQGKLDKALETYQRSLDIKVAAYGTEEHTSCGKTIANIALAQEKMGLLSDALVNAERALAIFTATLPAGHPYIARARADASRIAKANQE